MVQGCLNIGADAYYTQRNNVFEILDGPALNKCNVTAIVNAWAAVTPRFDEWENPFGGTDRIQPEDWVDLYFHDEKNWPRFKEIRQLEFTHWPEKENPKKPKKYAPARIPQYHPLALREIFGCEAKFTMRVSFSRIADLVWNGHAVILMLKKPEHFITAVAYDDEKKLIGFKDPAPVKWKENTIDTNKNKWFDVDDFANNIERFYTEVSKA